MSYSISLEGEAESHRDRISELMKRNSQDFVKPFDQRSKSFDDVVNGFVSEKYMIAAKKQGKIVGFLLYTHGGTREPIEEYCPCLYVNLVLVDRGFRNQGLAHKMYRKLIEEVLPESEFDTIGVRTQEVNPASRESIRDAGFEEKARDTEDGEQLIYYIFDS